MLGLNGAAVLEFDARQRLPTDSHFQGGALFDVAGNHWQGMCSSLQSRCPAFRPTTAPSSNHQQPRNPTHPVMLNTLSSGHKSPISPSRGRHIRTILLSVRSRCPPSLCVKATRLSCMRFNLHKIQTPTFHTRVSAQPYRPNWIEPDFVNESGPDKPLQHMHQGPDESQINT